MALSEEERLISRHARNEVPPLALFKYLFITTDAHLSIAEVVRGREITEERAKHFSDFRKFLDDTIQMEEAGTYSGPDSNDLLDVLVSGDVHASLGIDRKDRLGLIEGFRSFRETLSLVQNGQQAEPEKTEKLFLFLGNFSETQLKRLDEALGPIVS